MNNLYQFKTELNWFKRNLQSRCCDVIRASQTQHVRMGSSEQILKQDLHQDLNNITGDSLLYQWHGLQKSKRAFFPLLEFAPIDPKKFVHGAPHSLPEGDIRKWIAERSSGTVSQHLSASCCQTEISIWSQDAWEESQHNFVRQKKADTQFPAGQVKPLPQKNFNYKATTGVQGLRQICSSSHKVSTEAPEDCKESPESQSLVPSNSMQHRDTGHICILPSHLSSACIKPVHWI